MKKIRIGILGAGKIAGTMAKTIQKVGQAELYAVASRERQRAEKFAKQYGGIKAYGSYFELVKDEQIDLIYIATPHSHHYEQARLCLTHGRAVLCEKAFTANAVQAERLISLARDRKLFLMEAMWTRYMPLVDTAKRIINSGILGEIKMITANIGYKIADCERIKRPELAGGALLDLGVYSLNFVLMLWNQKIEKITSDVVMMDSLVDAQESITIKFENGTMAQLFNTVLSNTNCKGILYGEKGRMEIDDILTFQSVTVYDSDGKQTWKETMQDLTVNRYKYEIQECVDVLLNGGTESSKMPLQDSLYVMKILDQLRAEWQMKYPFEKETRTRQ